MKTTVILFRSESGWTLARFKGDTIPSRDFPTATAARAYAKSKGWGIRRAANCDA